MAEPISERRTRACVKFMARVHDIAAKEGITSSALHAMKKKLVALAEQTDLFPLSDFEMPVAQGRNHPLLVEEGDGYGLYLTINMPGKEAAAHDHGIWCVNAGVSGREVNVVYRRNEDNSLTKTGEVTVEPGRGTAMADHDIHSTVVIGTEPAVGLALYGFALARFPAVVWYHPEFSSVKASPSRRLAAVTA
jgi:predicted metal-dependent enzyme (double-stranded beta helix superfamily)